MTGLTGKAYDYQVSRVLDDRIEAGRDAFNRHAWQEAYEILTETDRSGLLPAEALRMLAQAGWWSGHPEAILEIGQRAYGAYLKEENRPAAAMMAFDLAQQYGMRMAGPMYGAWFARAEQLDADEPGGPVHGYLAWMRGFMTLLMGGDPDAAIVLLDEALEIAGRSGDRNVQGLSLQTKGWAVCGQGKIAEGLALIDEAMVAAVAGEMDPIPTGHVYCGMIGMCATRADYQRAAEWTEATTRWCDRNSITGFPGICRVHRAEILRLKGAWHNAEEEARRACEELPKYNLLFGMGEAFYEIGEIRRRMGDFVGAEEAYSRAHEFGKDPQPGLSLVRLAQGKVEAAAVGVRRVLTQNTRDRLARIRPLVAQIEIAITAGDLDTATNSVEELESIVKEVDTTALRAEASKGSGALRLAKGDPDGAIGDLRIALHAWQELEAPYEAAEIRVLLGKAYRALGDDDGALMELRAARDAFERLGAVWAVEKTGELLGELAASGGGPERVRRAFVFTDIVKSTDLVRAIGDEAWEDLLSWHDQTLRSVFASHGGEVAHPTGDGFFVAFANSEAALAGAVAVQRALAEHRRRTGFAPVVRIGVHVAEATRRGQDYGGGEVHKAARIAALAEGWEILASKETVEEARSKFKTGEFRDVSLKGISEPVEVTKIEWR